MSTKLFGTLIVADGVHKRNLKKGNFKESQQTTTRS